MLSFPGSLKVFIALDPIDMRAGINTLHALVATKLNEDASDGALFAFTNKSRRLLKVLYCDGTGMWLMTKRLEQGTFFWPRATDAQQSKLELRPEAFVMLTNNPRKNRTLDELIEHLPIVEIIIDPEQVKVEPAAWTCIGEEVTKLIDYIPGKFQSEHIIRRKYVRNDERHLPPIIAPLHTLQDRCIATPATIANTIAQRFELHLPLYRIEQQYARLGLPISRQPRPGGRAETDCDGGAARRARRAGASESNPVRMDRHGERRMCADYRTDQARSLRRWLCASGRSARSAVASRRLPRRGEGREAARSKRP